MSKSLALDPFHSVKTRLALKAEQICHRLTFNSSSAAPGEMLYVAFPKLNILFLLKKLEKYGIRPTPHDLFTSYLTNRQPSISLATTQSSKQAIVCGIPQGSSLGALLFLLYINDITNCSDKLSLCLFAEDTIIFISSSNLKHLEETVY